MALSPAHPTQKGGPVQIVDRGMAAQLKALCNKLKFNIIQPSSCQIPSGMRQAIASVLLVVSRELRMTTMCRHT